MPRDLVGLSCCFPVRILNLGCAAQAYPRVRTLLFWSIWRILVSVALRREPSSWCGTHSQRSIGTSIRLGEGPISISWCWAMEWAVDRMAPARI